MTDRFTLQVSTERDSLAEVAYQQLRARIIRLEYAPGDVLKEEVLRDELGLGRTPIREAVQRLAREHFVTVIPRRGMFVSGIDVAELSTLFETRMVLEPYAARLAATRGDVGCWEAMQEALDEAALRHAAAGLAKPESLMAVDRRCHELMWMAAENRFLLDTLDTLYAQSDRLWHLYLADVADMSEAVADHLEILDALRAGESDVAAVLVESHVRSFDEQIRDAVTERLASPLSVAIDAAN